MPDCAGQNFSVDCPSRLLFEQIADKWSMMVLTVLDNDPHRFNAIKRRLEGVTQKALTQCLRRLQRNGLIARRVIPVSPVAVEYSITPLGRTLLPPFRALYGWTVQYFPEVEMARSTFDGAASGAPDEAGPPRRQVSIGSRSGSPFAIARR